LFQRVASEIDTFAAVAHARCVFDIGIFAIHVALPRVLVMTGLPQFVQRDRHQKVLDILQIGEMVAVLSNAEREADQLFLNYVLCTHRAIQFARHVLGHDAHEF